MIVVLTCFLQVTQNWFRQEEFPFSGIKSIYLYSLTWFIKHIFFCIFNALTSLLQENANLLQIQRRMNGMQKEFLELQKNFRKMFHWKLEEVEFPLCMSWHFAATKKPFRNQLCHVMIARPFSFQASSSSMLDSTFSLPYTSWLPTCLPFWVAHISLIFNLYFAF